MPEQPEQPEQDDLLAAYLDGVSELTADERRAVEARLADNGSDNRAGNGSDNGSDNRALRDEVESTRALLGKLRELPPETDAAGGGPDWAALERSILGAVGTEAPRPWWRWWRRLGFRWAVPAIALAAAAAILALVVRAPERIGDLGPGIARPGTGSEPATPAPGEAPAPAGDTVALWLDGEGVEIALDAALDAAALLEVPWESDGESDGESADAGDEAPEDLLPASDLAWVDELAADELERAEALLKDPELKLPMRRKRS